jgi:hypothetical protein
VLRRSKVLVLALPTLSLLVLTACTPLSGMTLGGMTLGGMMLGGLMMGGMM